MGITWIGLSYLRYSLVMQWVCQEYDWWEDEAECAAQFALHKNDPRYCRVGVFSELTDVCHSIYAEKTTDASTCKKIDSIRAKNRCQNRFVE